MNQIIHILILVAVQILIVQFLFPRIKGMRTRENWMDSIFIVVLTALVNYALRFLLIKFTLGLASFLFMVTLGIMGVIVNAAALFTVSKFFPEKLKIDNFLPAVFGAGLLTIAAFIL